MKYFNFKIIIYLLAATLTIGCNKSDSENFDYTPEEEPVKIVQIELKTDTAWFYQLSSISLYALLYVSLFGTIGSYFLAQSAIKLSDPIIASLSYYFLPIFTYFSSFILLEEKLTPGLIVGTVLVFISVTLTTYSQQN